MKVAKMIIMLCHFPPFLRVPSMRKEVKDNRGYLVSISPHLLTRYNDRGDPLKVLVQNQRRNVVECSDGRIREVEGKGSL